MTHVKPNKFIGQVGFQPDSELIRLGYVKILSNVNLIGSGGNIFKSDSIVDRASSSRNSTK